MFFIKNLSKKSSKSYKLNFLLFALVFSLFCVLTAQNLYAGQTILLNWDANTEPDLAGYRVYQDGKLQSPDIVCLANDKQCCKWTSQELTEGHHEWYATAFDKQGNESLPSNTVSYEVDLTAPAIPKNIKISINISIQ